MLSDAQWAVLEPLVEACRPKGKTPPQDLRRTLSAILWRHQNGAKWRAIPADLGPWSRAAQTFIRWARLGVAGPIFGDGHEPRRAPVTRHPRSPDPPQADGPDNLVIRRP